MGRDERGRDETGQYGTGSGRMERDLTVCDGMGRDKVGRDGTT